MVSYVADACSVSWKLGVSTLTKLGVSTRNETWGFHLEQNLGFALGIKLWVSCRLSYIGGTSSSGELKITNFVDVVCEDNELRWGGYKVFN
jgi:hypothetical protein